MATINIRIDDRLKEESREVLEDLGLDLSTGIKAFLTQVVVKNGLPFELTLNELDMSVMQIENGKGVRVANVDELMEKLNED